MRVIKDGEGTVLQRFDYYPFGSESRVWTAGTSTPQSALRYRFGGKEIAGQKVSVSTGAPAAAAGSPYLDFGARVYDPRTAAWLSQDPLSEKYYSITPYAYCAGNPVNLVDHNGQELVIYYNDRNGTLFRFHFTGGRSSHPNPFVNDVIQTYYKSKAAWKDADYQGSSPLVELIESDYTVSVMEAGLEGNVFNNAYNTIYWDSRRGLNTQNGILSPATGLEHEADHALAFNKDPLSYMDRVHTPDKNYTNKEERRVITGSEFKTAFAYGEISEGQNTRNGHNGDPVIVKGALSNEIDDLENDKFQQKWKTFLLYQYSSE